MLWTGAFVGWIGVLTRWKIDPFIWADCKIGFFLFYFCSNYSSALLVILSIEKFVALYFPFKTKMFCSKKVAKLTSSITALILFLYNIQYIVIYDVFKDKNNIAVCHTSYVEYLAILDRIDSVLYSFGTFSIMFLLNFAIISKFMTAKCTEISTQSTSQTLNKYATRSTTMVVTVSLTFIVLTAPAAVDQALGKSLSLNYPIYGTVMIGMQHLNHSINDVLYCIVGSKFRKELLKLLCTRLNSENIPLRSDSQTSSRFWRPEPLTGRIQSKVTYDNPFLKFFKQFLSETSVTLVQFGLGLESALAKGHLSYLNV